MDFVWQYIYEPSAWRKMGIFNELEYSIRSVLHNVKDARIIVVGDKPPVSMDVIHIPGPPQVKQSPSCSLEKSCTIDKLNKMIAMANSDEVGDEFVLMYDDMFIMQPTTVEDLKINWVKSEITNIEEYLKSPVRTGDTSYKRVWLSTYEFIKMIRDSEGKKTYDWEAHTPRYFVKEKLKDILNKFDLISNRKLAPAIYDCYYAENSQIITTDVQSDLWTHKPGMDFDELLSKQYLNIYDNVIVPEFIEKMKSMFG